MSMWDDARDAELPWWADTPDGGVCDCCGEAVTETRSDGYGGAVCADCDPRPPTYGARVTAGQWDEGMAALDAAEWRGEQ